MLQSYYSLAFFKLPNPFFINFNFLIFLNLGYFGIAIVIHNADIQDREGAKYVLEELRYKYPRLTKILADQGYTGNLAEWILKSLNYTLEIVKKVAGISGFNVLPKRWIVERTFGWLGFQRRLVNDYEFHPECSTSFVHLAND
ncbi:MAG: transposase [Bacteroidia bacterium]|nr:transposase [Bacteroidia bacterium]